MSKVNMKIYIIRGFFCDVDDLEQPLTCTQGTYRMQDGNNDTTKILDQTNYLDFLKPGKKLYSDYKAYKQSTDNNLFYLTSTVESYEGNTQCIMCPPGYYCPLATVLPTKCAPGTYCENGFYKSSNCPQGTYNPFDGQFSCKACDVGFICSSEGLTVTTPCPAGYYCDIPGIGTTNQEYTLGVFKIAKK